MKFLKEVSGRTRRWPSSTKPLSWTGRKSPRDDDVEADRGDHGRAA